MYTCVAHIFLHYHPVSLLQHAQQRMDQCSSQLSSYNCHGIRQPGDKSLSMWYPLTIQTTKNAVATCYANYQVQKH